MNTPRLHVALLCTLLISSAANGQAIDSILALIKRDNAWTLAQQKSICEIAAPPFHETTRGAEFKRRLESLGLTARMDSVGNVIAERRGSGNGPTVVLAGHLDTVFPEGTDVRVTESNGRMKGPGIGDDCRGLAVVLAVARAYQRVDPSHVGRVIFVGDVGEEGPGNLRGVRHLFTRELQGQIDYFISVDGTGTGLVSAAVGSNRYRVHYKGPGGHSYGSFGIPNPIHAMGRAIAKIADIQVPPSPKTTFNVGVVGGGTSVNSIPYEAVMEVDMRSESADALRSLNTAILAALQDALTAENSRWTGDRAERARITMVIDTIGIRPTGSQPDTAYIVQSAMAAARQLGFTPSPGAGSAGSTDSNVPIALGVPAVTIDGGGHGEGAHSLNEWYEDGPRGWIGPQWAALLVAKLVGAK